MAKKKTRQNVTATPAQAKPVQKQPANRNTKQAADPNDFFNKYGKVLIPLGIGIITFLFFRTCIDNKLTNWDDLGYILTDQLIKDTGPNAIKNIFALDQIGR